MEKHPVIIFQTSASVFRSDALTAENAASVLPETDSIRLMDGSEIPAVRKECDPGYIDVDTFCSEPGTTGSQAVLVLAFDAPSEGTVRLSVGCDYWFTGFVNGKQVCSTEPNGNGPGSPTAFDHPFSVQVKQGRNVLSCFLRRGAASWAFCCTFIPVLPGLQTITERKLRELFLGNRREIHSGPFLLDLGTEKADIAVLLKEDFCAFVEYRKKGTADWIKYHNNVLGQYPMSRWHRFSLKNLLSGTEYEYRVGMEDARLNPVSELSPVRTFRTFAEKQDSFSLFMMGDLQFSPPKRAEIVRDFFRNCDAGKADIVGTVGDVDSDFTDFKSVYFDSFLTPLTEQFASRSVPYLPVRGNHEYRGGESSEFFRYFGIPYRLFRAGDTCFLMLDCGEDKDRVEEEPHRYTMRTDWPEYARQQRAWLLTALESPEYKTAQRHIVLAHATPFRKDAHFGYYTERNLTELLEDLFYGPNPKYPLDLWIAGHTHKSLRFLPDGEKFASLRTSTDLLEPMEKGRYSFPVLVLDGPGSVGPSITGAKIDFLPDRIEYKAMEPDGKVVDHVRFFRNGKIEIAETVFPQN